MSSEQVTVHSNTLLEQPPEIETNILKNFPKKPKVMN